METDSEVLDTHLTRSVNPLSFHRTAEETFLINMVRITKLEDEARDAAQQAEAQRAELEGLKLERDGALDE